MSYLVAWHGVHHYAAPSGMVPFLRAWVDARLAGHVFAGRAWRMPGRFPVSIRELGRGAYTARWGAFAHGRLILRFLTHI